MMDREKLKNAGKDAAATAVVGTILKPAVKALGDKMETAKKPFWRKLVRFFRGKPENPA